MAGQAPQGHLPLALSLGDPAGIGPELILQCWLRRKAEALAPFFVAGGGGILNKAARVIAPGLPVIPIAHVKEAIPAFARGLPVLGPAHDGAWQPGQPDEEGARLALDSLRQATRLVVEGKAAALVTAPVSKAWLAAIGFACPGQTEFLASACGVAPDDAVMMLAGPSLRTVPLTIHVPLSEVPALLSVELITRRARIVAQALRRDFGIKRPRLAVAGLNPHAGENAMFGDEERQIIAPAIARLREEGIEASGPHSADALFSPRARAGYDVALCMYHDQALIPVKALDFDQGVNVTLGLPILRTSPDHGTAFAIAGKGLADPGAMIAAIRMAGACAARRAAA
ncbi:MAG: 4-hydroxythreonine-4-phosphate dehydrogenase PdxA [Novosphingobium sp.]|nr:4-hydroxythreonine-4-phosphate dehydrogenase PdxA [Novosphingobium sp.]